MPALLSIGMFIFSVPTLSYEELRRRTEWRHARNGRVGARDATQFIGRGEETISLNGRAHDELCDGAASLDQLRALADAGDPNSLVCASGRVYGSYVIICIDERETLWWPDGTAREIEFGIDLLAVDDPLPATA